METREREVGQMRSDLRRILAVLWTMAGLGRRDTILRSLHRAVTRLLRPAEAATRRLIVVLAQKIVVTLKPSRPRQSATEGKQSNQPGIPSGQPNHTTQPEARWKDFALADPLPRWRDYASGFPGIVDGPDKEIDGQHLALRFEALNHALDDLNAQALRMARWAALRKRARTRGKFRSIHPLRPGPPADLRGTAGKRLKRHELHSILKDAHQRAWWASSGANDTS